MKNIKEHYGKIIIILLVILIIIGLNHTNKASINIEAEVLSIESKVLRGELIGMILGSSDGKIQNDAIIVGVKIEICKNIFLEDLKLRHSELAYYRDKTTLPLKVTVINSFDESKIILRLNGRPLKSIPLTPKYAKSLIEDINRTNESD